jgi:hypothetical protein
MEVWIFTFRPFSLKSPILTAGLMFWETSLEIASGRIKKSINLHQNKVPVYTNVKNH